MRADLHIHTTASDGSLTPAEVVARARERGLAAIAITDHDTMDGVAEARAAAGSLRVAAGIELSAAYGGTEVHLLGYFPDPEAAELHAALDWMRRERERRNAEMVRLLRQDGYDISIPALCAAHPGTVLGRPHLAQRLIELGVVGSVRAAFLTMLGQGKKYYVPRSYLPLEQAVQAVLHAGGAPVLAHPLQYRFSDLGGFVSDGAALGIVGLETHYTGYSPDQVSELDELAKTYGLVATGGSDFHGSPKPNIEMYGFAALSVLDELEERRGTRQ